MVESSRIDDTTNTNCFETYIVTNLRTCRDRTFQIVNIFSGLSN